MITKIIVNELSVLIAATVVALSPLQQAAAKLNQATLSFTPSGAIKPRVQSELAPVTPGARYSTGATELREVLLPDGTVLSLGLGSQVVVEDYAYSRDDLKGRIVIYVEFGLVRVVGGLINNSGPILVRTPTAEIRMNNAAANISVSKGSGVTRVSLLYGQSLSMTSDGGTESLVKPGFELVSRQRRAAPEGPSRQDERVALADIAALETLQLSTMDDSGEGGSYDDKEDASRINALATEDREAGEITENDDTSSSDGSDTSNGNTDTSNGDTDTTDTGSGHEQDTNPPAAAGSVATDNSSGGLGAGQGGDSSNYFQTSGSHGDVGGTDFSQAMLTDISQVYDKVLQHLEDKPNVPLRERGRTANRIFNSQSPFTQSLDSVANPISATDFNGNSALNYQFEYLGSGSANLLVLTTYPYYLPDAINGGGQLFVAGYSIGDDNTVTRFDSRPYVNPEAPTYFTPLFDDYSRLSLLQSGFEITNYDGTDFIDSRKPDNFFVVEVNVLRVQQRIRDQLKEQYTIEQGAVSDIDAFRNAVFGDYSDSITLSDAGVNALAAVILDADAEQGAAVGASEVAEALAPYAEELSAGLSSSLTVDVVLNNANTALDETLLSLGTERFLFANGDVDAGRIVDGKQNLDFKRVFSVDHFFVSPGLADFEQKDEGHAVADGIRAFLRERTGLDLTLADSGLLVVNTGSDSADAQNALLHADFGLEGVGSDQQSTISVTIGDVEYYVSKCDECFVTDSVEVLVNGQTIGSSHGRITPVDAEGNPGGAVDDATVAFTSPLRSTAAGGGNPALNREGYAGYFVLENYDPSPQSGFDEPSLYGGTERPIGNPADSQDYAYLRLATATGTEAFDNEQMQQRKADDGQQLKGWLAGLGEYEEHVEDGNSQTFITPVNSGDSPENFVLKVNSETSQVQVSNADETGMTLFGYENGQRSLVLGGLTKDDKGTSAFVDGDRFAARTQSGGALDAALVSGELVRDGLPAEMQAATPDYQYLKWGFFFGDTLNDSQAGKQMREHLHLATWVAGKVPQPGELPTSGEVSYAGHAIGNVYSGGAGYTAVGVYNSTWNFADRRGTVDRLDFDRAVYTGNMAVIDGTANFQGRLGGTDLGVVDASNRIGGLRGNFVQGGDDPVAGVAGRFSIQETTGERYRASGTFGAERNPPQ